MDHAQFFLAGGMTVPTQKTFESDTIATSAGDLQITFLGHGSLLFAFGGQSIYVDPYGQVADYGQLPKASVVLITHEHHDHLDPEALSKVRTAETVVVANEAGARQVAGAIAMRPGDVRTVKGLQVEAVPAYNVVHKRPNGQPFHPKGVGVGYVLTFGNQRVYVAGDTENIPEMKALRDIDIAFLPMNLPYTMAPEMVADAARAFRPRILYPYHYGETDTSRLAALLGSEQGIEVRIRRLA